MHGKVGYAALGLIARHDRRWVPVEAIYLGDTINVVDCAALKALIGEPGFLALASVSPTAVVAEYGGNVLTKVLRSEVKEPALKVRAKK